MTIRPVFALAVLSLGGLSACFDGSDPRYVEFDSLTSNRVDALNAQSLNVSARTTDQITGELDRQADTFELDAESGTIDVSRTTVTLNGGGTIDLTGTTEFARFFESQPSGGDTTTGVVGVPTIVGDVPGGGTATYSGVSEVAIQDGLALYDLNGTMEATADFSAGTLDVTLDNLGGQRQDFILGTSNVTDVATITISDAMISDNTVSGGTSTLTSATINGGGGFSGTQTTNHEAGFYGPRADEVGGVLYIDDTSVQVFGQYLGD